jgi:hypothetical protein
MPVPLGELRQNVGLKQQRSALRGQTPTRRQVGKWDLSELLSTARLADLKNELKAISPCAASAGQRSSSSGVGTPASQMVRPAAARHSDVHATGAAGAGGGLDSGMPSCKDGDLRSGQVALSAAGLDSAETTCKERAGASPLIGQVDLFGNPQDLSPTTLMQLEINRKRDLLFKPLGLQIGNKMRIVRTSKNASRRTSRATSRPASRRESVASQNDRRRAEELDQGESAGALRFRELQTQLHGHTHIPKTGTTPASPASLWSGSSPWYNSSSAQQGSQMCAGYSEPVGAQVTVTKNLSQESVGGGVVISVAPHARTPDYFGPTSDAVPLTRAQPMPLPTQRCPPRTPEASHPISADVAESPLTDFIKLFQATQDKEVGRLALRLWRSKAASSAREGILSSIYTGPHGKAGGVERQLEAAAMTLCSTVPCAAVPSSKNGSIFHCQICPHMWTRIATLVLRRILRDWLLVMRGRVWERLTVKRFIGRQHHRSQYASFQRWYAASGLARDM